MRPFNRTYSPGKILPNSRVESKSLFKGALDDLRRISYMTMKARPAKSDYQHIVRQEFSNELHGCSSTT